MRLKRPVIDNAAPKLADSRFRDILNAKTYIVRHGYFLERLSPIQIRSAASVEAHRVVAQVSIFGPLDPDRQKVGPMGAL